MAKLVRQLILNQLCPGSNPGRPSKDLCVLGCRQAGKAGDFESPMRWFESSRPIQADVVQRRECDHAKVEAEGSSPSIRSNVLRCAGIAQSPRIAHKGPQNGLCAGLERRFRKAEVEGSFPIPGSRVCR